MSDKDEPIFEARIIVPDGWHIILEKERRPDLRAWVHLVTVEKDA